MNSSLSISYGTYRFINSFGQIVYQSSTTPLVTGLISNIHFHSPSENFLNGIQYDLEMHIVMDDESGKYSHVVLGVLFKNSICSFIACGKETAALLVEMEILER